MIQQSFNQLLGTVGLLNALNPQAENEAMDKSRKASEASIDASQEAIRGLSKEYKGLVNDPTGISPESANFIRRSTKRANEADDVMQSRRVDVASDSKGYNKFGRLGMAINRARLGRATNNYVETLHKEGYAVRQAREDAMNRVMEQVVNELNQNNDFDNVLNGRFETPTPNVTPDVVPSGNPKDEYINQMNAEQDIREGWYEGRED